MASSTTVTIQRAWTELSSKLKAAVVGAVTGGTASVVGLDQVILWVFNGLFHLGGTSMEMPATVAAVIGTVLGALIAGYLTPDKLPAGTTVQTAGNAAPVAVGDITTPAAQGKA